MKSQICTAISFWVIALLAANVSTQRQRSTQIDEFGRPTAEDIEARLDGVVNQLNNNPESRIQFSIRRGRDDTYGLPYRRFATYKTYLIYRKVDRSRFFVSYCKPDETDERTQLWEAPANSSPIACEADKISILETTLFDRAPSATDRGTDYSCCVVDSYGPAAAVESIEEFGSLLMQHEGWKGYIFAYAGTNMYLTSDTRGRDIKVRHLDTRADIQALLNRARTILSREGVSPLQVSLRSGGYRDSVASYELWLVPPDGKIPTVMPNYFPRTIGNRKRPRR